MPITVERNVGRLIEGVVGTDVTLEETQQFRTRMWATISGITGKVVLIGNLVHADKLLPEIEHRLIEMFRHDNPKVERSALVWGNNQSGFAQQCARMIEAANGPQAAMDKGRGFADKRAAQRWLDEVLRPEESARLAEIIDAM